MRNRPIVSLVAVLFFSAFLLAYPVHVIRPFRHQGTGELRAALLVIRYRPAVEMVLVCTAIVITLIAWRTLKIGRKVSAVLVTLAVAACGLLTRINIYEKMFHPMEQPSFSSAAERKLDMAEQVIAVRVNNAARAYPIRDISYHHIVNDTLGGRAIVATY